MTYSVAEKFKSIQGEGVFAGTPMAFIRFVGCSVGKKTCVACDTDFEESIPWRGGGEFTAEELLRWSEPYDHICLTGGEPLDQNLEPLVKHRVQRFHLETSGTKLLDFDRTHYWVCVSPKPGFKEDVVRGADEIKVIMPGLGVLQHGRMKIDSGWPTLQDALRWADAGKIVFLQPRNGKFDVDMGNLHLCQDIIAEYPQLRLSTQLHKILKVQ